MRKGALAAERILVNAVAPGACATGFTKGLPSPPPAPQPGLLDGLEHVSQVGALPIGWHAAECLQSRQARYWIATFICAQQLSSRR